MLVDLAARDAVAGVRPAADEAALRAAIGASERIHVAPDLARYVVDLVGATRADERLRLGASPRAGLSLLRVAKALALMSGRGHVEPDDVKAMAPAVLAHRLVLAPGAGGAGLTGEAVVAEALARTPVPLA